MPLCRLLKVTQHLKNRLEWSLQESEHVLFFEWSFSQDVLKSMPVPAQCHSDKRLLLQCVVVVELAAVLNPDDLLG